MPTFYSPSGNPEVWGGKPDGYFDSLEDWQRANPPTPEELQQAFTDAIQAHLDGFAKTRNYDNIFTACTYATSVNPRYSAEGRYCVEARDATWDKAYEILDQVLTGQRPMPGPDDLPAIMAELPELRWPE